MVESTIQLIQFPRTKYFTGQEASLKQAAPIRLISGLSSNQNYQIFLNMDKTGRNFRSRR